MDERQSLSEPFETLVKLLIDEGVHPDVALFLVSQLALRLMQAYLEQET